MKKRGFTLIELVVSIVLVSIILVALIGSLLQLRNAYTVVHENSDVIVYTSSISRVINSDINDNNGIKFVSCETDGRKCSLILGNDERRELLITDNDRILDDTDLGIEHSNNKTTLKYLDTTKYDKTNNEEDKKLLYIRTLEIDKYQNETSGVTTTEGYGFYDMSATQYEYFENASENNIEAFTTITIRLLDGINMDVSKYDITLYGAGRYDYSNYVGRVYSIDLDNSEAETAGTTSIDEVFGVGYFVAESPHRKRDQITSIEIPTKSGKAFLGYYYKPYGVNVETKVIDSGGNIVSSSRQFKNDVKLNEETTGHVYAKWGDCELGFKIEDGKCVQEEYTVTLNKDQSGKTCDTTKGTANYRIKYQNMTPDVEIPQCAGYTFEGYLSTTNKPYHNRNGEGIEYYDIAGNSTFKASWSACAIGQYSLTSEQTCTDCKKGSYSGASASGRCTACQNGVTTNGNKQGSCNANCPNNNIHVATWKTAVWRENNKVDDECAIATCKTGYDGEISSNKCTVNTYKISFTLNGGKLDGVTSPTTRRVDYDTVETINNPIKAGYEFTGWTFDGNVNIAMHGELAWSNHNTKVKDTKFKNLTSTDEATVTLTANWSQCPAGTYNSGSGTTCIPCAKGSFTSAAGKTSCTVCQATGQAGTSGTTTDTGQSSCNQSCNKAHVSTWENSTWNNNTVNNSCIIKSCLTGYTLGSNACTANTYSISYAGMNNADYGTNHPITATYDSQFTVDNPTKAGHTFTGWDISGMDNVTHTYGSSTTTNLTISKTKETTFKNLRSTSGTVTFTATWSINQYTLTVKPNGGKWNDSTSNQTFTQDYASTKAIVNPTVGPTYTISYDMGSTGITKPTSPVSVQRPFTSWTKDGAGTLSGTTFTFGAGDGTLTANYNTTSSSFTLPSISKSEYTCKWAEGSASGTQYTGGTSRTITGNKTYYAVCTINSYKLTVNPNGGTWGGKTTSQDFTQNYGTTKTIANPTAGPTYSISYNMNGTGITAPTSPVSVQRPFTSWTNSGSGSISGTTYTYGAGAGTLTANYNTTSSSFTLPAISKSGYTCKWAEGSASGTQYTGGASRTITGNKTYYAVCTANSYILTVKPNGGTWGGKTTNQDFTQNYGTTKTIANPTAGPTYSISYNMNGTGVTKPTSPVSVQRPFDSWIAGGSGSISGTTYTFGAGAGTLTAIYKTASNKFTLPALSKDNFTCNWLEDSTSGTQYAPGAQLSISSNKTYYAKCVENCKWLCPTGYSGDGSGGCVQTKDATKTPYCPTGSKDMDASGFNFGTYSYYDCYNTSSFTGGTCVGKPYTAYGDNNKYCFSYYSYSYSCDSGWTLSGTSCYRTASKECRVSECTWKCPTGYTANSSGMCEKTTAANSQGVCPSGSKDMVASGLNFGNYSYYDCYQHWSFPGSTYAGTPYTGYGDNNKYYFSYYESYSYTCPYGGVLNGQTCKFTVEKDCN